MKNDTENTANYAKPSNQEGLEVGEILLEIIKRKTFVIFFCLSVSILSVIGSYFLPIKFNSAATLAPVDSSQSLSGALKGLGGIASLAGISVDAGSASKGQEAIKIIKSFRFFEELNSYIDIIPDLLAAKEWNKETKVLEYSNDYNQATNLWNDNSKPSLQTAYRYFHEKVLTISEDKKTGFVYINIEHISPTVAKKWVEVIIFLINERFREYDIQIAQRSIEYLNGQLASTALFEVREGISQLIQSQTQRIMVAKSTPEYVFKIIENPIASEVKFKPRRVIILLSSLLGSFFIAILIVLWPIFKIRLIK